MENPRLTSSRHVIIEVFTEGCLPCKAAVNHANELARSTQGCQVLV